MKKLFVLLSALVLLLTMLVACDLWNEKPDKDATDHTANDTTDDGTDKQPPENIPIVEISDDGYWIINGEKTRYTICTCDTVPAFGATVEILRSTCSIKRVLLKCPDCRKYAVTEIAPTEEHNYVNRVCTVCKHNYVSLDLEYTLNDDGLSYTVSGIGTCKSADIVIPDTYEGLPVTAIGDGAFKRYTYAPPESTKLRFFLGSNITSIGKSAFSGAKIEEITIPSSVRSIGDYAFCRNEFKHIKIPEGVTSIGSHAFEECEKMESISLPNTLTSIGNAAFIHCVALKSLRIPDDITEISDHLLDSCISLTDVDLPNSIKSIGDSAFLYCESLGSIKLPEGITSIGNSSFTLCTSLASVTLPSTLESIGEFAFSFTPFKNVDIPENVTNINIYAFFGCEALEDITVHMNNQHYKSQDGILYTKDGTVLVLYPNNKAATSFTVPYGVRSIGKAAFYMTQNLEEVIISDTVEAVGYRSFYMAEKLKSVHLGSNVTTLGNEAFSGCINLVNVDMNDALLDIGESAFSSCLSLKSIKIPEGTTVIDIGAFSGCDSLTVVVIPDSVTLISKYAFASCASLSVVVLGPNLYHITDTSFNSSPVTTVFFKGTEEDWSNITSKRSKVINNATRYYYSDTPPTEEGNFWHYGEDGSIIIW